MAQDGCVLTEAAAGGVFSATSETKKRRANLTGVLGYCVLM